jgi:hypothetical protein
MPSQAVDMDRAAGMPGHIHINKEHAKVVALLNTAGLLVPAANQHLITEPALR